MRPLRVLFIRLAELFRKGPREHDLTAEMESHLQMHIEDNLRAGMNRAEARREALIKLGGIEQTKEIYRERRGLPFFETFFHDLRYACRMLLKNPASLRLSYSRSRLVWGQTPRFSPSFMPFF